jgi:hypothetical protein
VTPQQIDDIAQGVVEKWLAGALPPALLLRPQSRAVMLLTLARVAEEMAELEIFKISSGWG